MAGALLIGLLGAALGDLVVGTIFDIRGEVSARSYAAVSAAAVLSVTATLATVQLVAEQRNRLLLVGWSVPLLAAVAIAVVGRMTEVDDIALGLVALHAGGAHADVGAVARPRSDPTGVIPSRSAASANHVGRGPTLDGSSSTGGAECRRS